MDWTFECQMAYDENGCSQVAVGRRVARSAPVARDGSGSIRKRLNMSANPAIKQQSIPGHVPGHLVFDFDIYADPRLERDVHAGYMSLHDDAPDVFFTPRNGGHWVMTRYKDVSEVMMDGERFSSTQTVVPVPPLGLKVPVTPLDMDEPEHRKYRALLNKFMSPAAVQPLEPVIHRLNTELLDGFIGRGRCEFVADYAVPLPVLSFLSLMKWDTTRYREFVSWTHVLTGKSEPQEKGDAMRKLNEFLVSLVDRLSVTSGDDPISFLLASSVDGARLPKSRVIDMGSLLFLGGLDTVTNAMAFIVRYLADNPEKQAELRDNPGGVKGALDELMRRIAFVNTARVVTRDTEINGVSLKAGDMVIGSLCAGSNDPRKYECPANVEWGRKGAGAHLAFNTGVHNCAGMPLAKLELRIWLEEWLKRVPAFRIAPGFQVQFRAGQTMGIEALELEWAAQA
jgi:cytochrome P450